ncbi:MAG: hypothetical protein ABSG36_06140 [Acidimicrobiales bacterium]|jgi:hypothetical protein
MDENELVTDPPGDRSGRAPAITPRQHVPRPGGLAWGDVLVSSLVMLMIAVPTMALEEDWHGHPMLESTHLWIVPGCLVAAAFIFGGALAGHRRPSAATKHATLAASLAVLALLGAALARRLWIAHEGVPGGVVRLWCLAVGTALVLSATGSVLGRRLNNDRG